MSPQYMNPSGIQPPPVSATIPDRAGGAAVGLFGEDVEPAAILLFQALEGYPPGLEFVLQVDRPPVGGGMQFTSRMQCFQRFQNAHHRNRRFISPHIQFADLLGVIIVLIDASIP